MLPTVEPAAQRAAHNAPSPMKQQAQQQHPAQPPTEILGNTVDPHWHFAVQTVPTRCSMTVPGGLPFGFVVQPFAAPEDSTRWLRREAERCQGCGAFRNLYVSVEAHTGRWLCNFCGHVSTSEDLKGKVAIESCRELRDAVVEFVEPVPGVCRAELVGNNTYIFAIDTTIRQRDLVEMQAAIVSVTQAMHATDHVGLVAFDGVVKVFDLSKQDCASAHILPGISSPSQFDLNVLGASGAIVTAPVHTCIATLVAIVKSLKPPVRQPSRAKGMQRCLGAAVETAIAIAAASSRKATPTPLGSQGVSPSTAKARVLVLLGGPPTCGPGVAPAGDEETDRDRLAIDPEEDEAAAYYAAVGLRSRMLGVAVDIFAVSSLGVGVGRLQSLTSACGGHTVVHSSFGDAFRQSLTCSATGAGAAGRSRAVIDLHSSPLVDISRVIGPLVSPATKEEEALAESLPNLAICPGVNDSEAFTCVFQLQDDVTDDFIYFQVAAAHTNSNGERILRVSTQRLAVTNNMALLMQSVDVDVAAVLMGKEAVVAVGEGSVSPEEARHELSQRLNNIANTFGGQVKLTMHGRMATLPVQLSALPALIFHLHNGPLLGPLLNDDDNAEAIRLRFLNASVADARRMLCPKMHACALDGSLALTEVALEDLSLLPDRLLVLDHHTHVFIWSGSQVAGSEFDAVRLQLRQAIAEWAAARFPAPEVLEFKEGASMARWLLARLDPASKDAPAGNLVAGLAGAVRGLLQSRFAVTDDLSMSQWLVRYRMAL